MGLWQDIREDWSWYRRMPGTRGVLREPGFWICAVHRLGWHGRLRRGLTGKLLRALYAPGKLLVLALTGADIRSGARIGRRCTVHTAPGIVIADGVILGDDCILNAGVGVVNKANGRGEGVPTVGDRVMLSMGAKVLGNVRIGDDAWIGANAVVLSDVPAGAIAAGVPAVIKGQHMQAPDAALIPSPWRQAQQKPWLSQRGQLRLRARTRARKHL